MNSTPTLSFFADFRRRLQATHPLSARAGLAFAVLALPALVGIFVDPRLVNGEPVWLKPFKFLVSAALYAWTFAWFLSFIEAEQGSRLRKWIRRLGTVSVVALVFEIAIIVFQAGRGIASHFNVDGALNSAFWSIMAWSIIALWVANLAAMVLLLRQKSIEAAFGWSLRLGIVIASLGMLGAFQMTGPTPDQLAAMQAGEIPTRVGAHTTGGGEAGAQIPAVYWNRDRGDLRVPHFFSLHAMQVLPLLGWRVARRRRYSDRQKKGLVWAAAGWYFAVFVLLTVQALLDQGFFAPSPALLTAFALTSLAAAALLAFFHWSGRDATKSAATQEALS